MPNGKSEESIKVQGKTIPYLHVAELSGVRVLQFEDKYWEEFKKNEARKKLHKEISKRHIKHLILFSDNKKYLFLSYLSKDHDSKSSKAKTHSFFKEQSGDIRL